MRSFISVLFFGFIALNSFAQDLNKYFAQGKFNSEDKVLMKSIEQSILNKPDIWMVRIDPTNGNVLIFSNPLPFWTEEELSSLFGENADLFTCPFIGIVRQDEFRTFPFDNCE
jgi:hypothetical protein